MDLKETSGKETRPGPPPRGIPNLGRRIFASAFWTILFGGTGFLLFNYTKDIGTEKNRERMKIEKLQGRGDQTPGKEQMIIDTLMGKGPASLAELREITTQKRYKIAEENMVYAVPIEKKDSDSSNKASNENIDKENSKDNDKN